MSTVKPQGSVKDPYRPPTAAPPSEPATTELYAGFWRRVAAYFIDGLILLIPCIIVGIIPILGFFLQIGIWATYKAVFEAGEKQATPGKRAMGIKVTTLDGERISVGQALGRYFGSILSGLILSIGYMMAGFTARKQALHDMMASTLVVNADASEEDVREGAGTMPMTIGVWIAVIVIFIFPFGGGILAAIAIPAYQDYTIRSKMQTVVNLTASLQAETAQAIQDNRGKPTPPVDVTTASPYIRKMTIDLNAGTIRAELNTDALKGSRMQSGAALVRTMNRNTPGWACVGEGIPNKYLPASCRS
jgi:uncharacterized RDD family membrane protein YckC/Tfp pilus assembly major pilin PilA